ncbi:hypothetical protein BDM02DRAFT_3088779 [Thelephora ganbajun]|uniref:Uncharacterized protein n=1 Tax=Thelephora ganbajun TaxID=370292 RepID=A0ACB6ZTX2_THEGA|nr:hypothetical protein BDM02DRAFT_3088779 [Thelephora ganbajun]
MSTLLPFHVSITDKLCDPANSDLLLLAHGLGLRRIVCKLLQIYHSSQSLVCLVNASSEEENGIGEELNLLGCRSPGFTIIGFEIDKKARQELYRRGGIFSVTSQILIVDMLQSTLPTEMITGIMILHAERVSALSQEAFIVRLLREKNEVAFVKALSDQPEYITSGLAPLRNVVKELRVQHVYIYPRFHDEVKQTLEKKRIDVIQLLQGLTESMKEIHGAIIQCINSTMSELKRSHTNLDLDDLNVDNAYFRSFDAIVRRQLDPVWHKVGPRTKQLVADLATLRRLLTYLLAYNAVAFLGYLDTIQAANSVTTARGAANYQSPWLLTDQAGTIFREGKRRCYSLTTTKQVLDAQLDEDEEAWEALDEIQSIVGGRIAGQGNKQPVWPKGLEPILEEQPKWARLVDILNEIEEEIRSQQISDTPGTNTILVMTATSQSAATVSEYLSTCDRNLQPGERGRVMMERKLRGYLSWRAKLAEIQGSNKQNDRADTNRHAQGTTAISAALLKKDQEKAKRAASRRRVRGGAPDASGPTRAGATSATAVEEEDFIGLLSCDQDFDMNYGLVQPEETVIVRAYSDDSDDMMLMELRPRFVVMFDPSLEFLRRMEVYRSSNPGLPLRIYFLMYEECSEEHKYLLGLRREKNAFTRLIEEHAKMPIYLGDARTESASSDVMIKTISTRFAGGKREISQVPSRVIVDMREFRSSLPSILHASKLQLIPTTLTVADYVLTPDICVERKSIPDLVSSFNSGRLYTQCELMSVHYKHPLLLIEFEEHKSFSLEVHVTEARPYAKGKGKFPSKVPTNVPEYIPTLQEKIVMLTLAFPRLRIIWSSSAHATAEIFNDLKLNNPEPDPERAVLLGAEENLEVDGGANAVAEELLRSLPGITEKNVKHVMGKVPSIKEFCQLELAQVQEVIGVNPGKSCYDFMHHGDRGGTGSTP